MIRVDRDRVDPPPVLTGPKSRGVREAMRAAASLAKWKDGGNDATAWQFKFKVYSDDDVKLRLTELFGGKCAYCESRYGATQPMDVEHWRPKGQIASDTGAAPHRPAYYWLAATWTNLLPSCIDCNRRRWQTDLDSGERRLLGKEDCFPLEQGSPRAVQPGEEGNERPLLLDPTADAPERYLAFTDDAVVGPASDDATVHDRARASIDVYGLNRSALVQARKERTRVALLLLYRIERVTAVLTRYDKGDTVRTLLEELLLLDLRELARMRAPNEPYTQQIRQVIDRHVGAFLSGSVINTPVDEKALGRLVGSP